MSIDQDIRLLKHQITLLNVAVHAISRNLTPEQKAAALSEFSAFSQAAQSHLEASRSSEEDLTFFVDIRQSLEKALGQ